MGHLTWSYGGRGPSRRSRPCMQPSVPVTASGARGRVPLGGSGDRGGPGPWTVGGGESPLARHAEHAGRTIATPLRLSSLERGERKCAPPWSALPRQTSTLGPRERPGQGLFDRAAKIVAGGL